MGYPGSRRSFLKRGGVALSTVAFAGCSSLSSGEEGIELGHIFIQNNHSNSHTVRIELERGDDVLLEETIELMAKSSEIIEATWSSEPAIYDLSYVVLGPDEPPDIRTKRLTADDKQSEEDSCNYVYLYINLPDFMHPHVVITPTQGDLPPCTD